MTGYTQGYELYTSSPKFTGTGGYNPEVTVYYGSDDNIVRITETWHGKIWTRTISGSHYAQYWPNYAYTETFFTWEQTTVS